MFLINKTKKYLNSQIKQEIKEKGFGVYNYISLGELLLTVRKDYLTILNKINIIFGIFSIIFGIFSFYSENYSLFLGFIFGVYAIIFLFLFIKLIIRTHHFLKISDVIYTNSGIILGEKIYKYSDTKILDKKLIFYEKYFSEYLGMPSNLKKIISEKKKSLIFKGKNNSSNILKKILYYSEKIFRNTDNDALAKLAIPALISFLLYVFFIYIFYYIGYFISFIIFFIYSFFLKIILYFKNSIELKIKNITIKLNNSFRKMSDIYSHLSEKINNFKDGEIENISNFVGKEFKNFYKEINKALNNKNKLFEIIKNSKYKNFIDFILLKKYIKSNFNKPILNMIIMLKKYKLLLEENIKNMDFSQKNLKEEYEAILTNRKIILEKNLENINRNIVILEETIM